MNKIGKKWPESSSRAFQIIFSPSRGNSCVILCKYLKIN